MKKQLIKKIKTLISEIGNTSTGEMGCDSPIYNQLSKDHYMTVEGYNTDNITVVEYIHEQEINEFTAPYEDLKGWQLKQIWEDLGEYAVSLVDNY